VAWSRANLVGIEPSARRGGASTAAWARALDGALARRRIALPLLLLIAAAFTYPLYAKPMHLGHGDWLWFHFTWDSSRRTWLGFREVPYWNPYYCGGSIGLANPQSFGLSPIFLLLLPLPTALAMKVYLSLMTFIGAAGMYELASYRYARGLGAVMAAVLFACSGFMGWHFNGQTAMAAFDLLPFAMLFFLRGSVRWEWALASGGMLALMILSGGVYPLTLSVVAIGIYVATSLADGRAPFLRAVRSGAVAAAGLFGLASMKLLPLLDFLRDHHRPIGSDDPVTLRLLWDTLFVKRTTETQIWPHGPEHPYAWWGEYGNYLGWAGVLLVGGAVLLSARRHRREIVLAAATLAIAWGDHGPYSPFALMRKLPLLGSLRVPTRYLIVLDLWLACLAAYGIRRAIRLISVRLRGAPRAVAYALLGVLVTWTTVDMVRTNGIAVLGSAIRTPPAPPDEPPAVVRQVMGSSGAMYLFPPRNHGTLRCFDEMTVEISPALRPDLRSEVFLAEPLAGQVTINGFTPNEWRFSVDVDRPSRVIVNQNTFRGWRAEGGVLATHRGLLAVDVPEGRHDVRLFYRPPYWGLSLWLTLGTAAFGLALAVRARRPRT
jgi:hypothetical protein